ncbi:glycosyltransferase [Aliarcobacter butzleri]|uniref:glycosyltransferase n=1 Tax=Aliarcobacter butzleri TaxID=28197 RepID=UPI00263F18EC|nr:glycosyltransferase [Aliarcobacter butzleri]MDN5067890.1 glycosyltransferase [Aliarcobacter butzleri]MDN5072708.1 glycosyltransferase [Aliarcobacter butzleri]MDN5121686.1 glycosyltransferase [Aliarcobacter butzleri]
MIFINALGIQDSGGITVLQKLLNEIKNSHYNFLIICNKNENIYKLYEKYKNIENFEFLIIPSKGFLHRLYFQNIVFRKIIKEKNIELVYNFSGSSQFFSKVPQMTKVHNLLFYSKKIDKVYFEKKEYLKWLKQIFLKRIIFHTMLRRTKYVEVQSNHVKEYISDFINISNKQFFIKSDIDVSDNLFLKPKNYYFTKRIKFLYIVGPHFEYLHKNFENFVKAMKVLRNKNFDFEIVITLTQERLYSSILWDKTLDDKTTFLGYISKEELLKEFIDNTILVSTSIIETLGLHVIEAVQNGILAIVPNEKYSLDVYGNNILTYNLFNSQALVKTIKNITLLTDNEIKDIITENQNYLTKNESTKNQNIVNIFDEILKDKNV